MEDQIALRQELAEARGLGAAAASQRAVKDSTARSEGNVTNL